MRFQRRVDGGRDQLPSCVLPKIKAAVERDAKRFDVSRSFVIAVAIADHYGIDDQERIEDPGKRRNGRRR